MMKEKRGRILVGFVILLVLTAGFSLWNLHAGSVTISAGEIRGILFDPGVTGTNKNIIWSIRLPRLLSALVLGGALSVSGYLLQTFFHNPIAGPFTLGISSGAKLVVALVMVAALGNAFVLSSWVMIIAAFVGAMICMGFVILMSKVMDQMSMLIVSGVMIGYICSAITDIVVTFAQDSNIVNLHNWSMGSFSGVTWGNVQVAACVVLPALAASFCLSKPMAAYQLGESYAKSVGVAVRPFSMALVLLSSLLAACVTAFAGPISFVGIAVPHLVKGALGSAKPLHVLPGCALGGAAFCLLCDLIARSLFAPTELSISSVTAVFGAPVVIWLLVRRSQEGAR